ncbi:MAG: BON domain-containing protein [Nitrincola lacisaponensis]|uniref:BON domain-containing protein n=1 Tax=Nitrincola lacisaponensis TaxID=267850 RepID=UPI00391CF416
MIYKHVKNNAFSRILLTSSIPMVLAGASGSALGQSVSSEIRDARQEAQIETSYALNPYLHDHPISIVVAEGKAVLTGVVDEEVYKELAQQIALGVPGITSVDNQINVHVDTIQKVRTEGERSFGELVEDASITAAVKSKLLWSTYTDGMDSEVSTHRGVVTLTGIAESNEEKALAETLALSTRGVRSVDNQLVISTEEAITENPKNKVDSAGQAISDSWITTKVKSTYLMSSNIHSRDISVSTTEGVVTLSGNIHSRQEHDLAIELAQGIKGVKSVSANELNVN